MYMKKYRIFLILLLAAAIGGGVWYCCYASHQSQTPREGILVEKINKGRPLPWA